MLCVSRTFFVCALFLTMAFPGCGTFGRCEVSQQMTPLLFAVHDAPVPFKGSDGLVHLVYEVWLANISSGEADIQDIEVIGDGAVLQRLDATAVSHRLQPAGLRESSGVLARGTQSILFLNVVLPNGTQIPKQLLHRVKAHYSAAPPGQQEIVESGGATTPDLQPVVQISAPLRGDGYISVDSCCDSTRHMRAAIGSTQAHEKDLRAIRSSESLSMRLQMVL
jgi:hypothetical protein